MNDQNTTVSIRHVVKADCVSIQSIYTDAVLHGVASWEYTPPTVGDMELRIERVVRSGYPFLVAEVDGEIAGYAYGSAFRDRIGYRYTVEDSIYLSPDHQGKGIGKLLLNALITECTERGYRQMVAVIGDSSHTASIRLHESVGFVHKGTLPNIGFKFDRWLDWVVMQRAL